MDRTKILYRVVICLASIAILLLILCIALIIKNIQDVRTMNNILNTQYEICVHQDGQEVCYRQKIDDYLKNYD